ncbi:hypothetical protein ACOMHN_031517 [Nucella lapillus]
MFRLPTRNKTTWMHPRSRHWHLIDYVIIRAKDRQDVGITKAVCGADCWTDNRLIVSKLKFSIQQNEIHALLEDKRRLLRAHQNDPSSMAKKAVFTNMRNTV